MSSIKKEQVSDLKKHIGYWLRLVSNSVSYSFARRLEDHEVTVAEWVILREMYESDEAMAPSDLAEITGLTRGAISKLVDRLLKKKLLSRKDSATDRRYQSIQLTAAARVLVPKLARQADENDESFFSELNKEEKKSLTALLMKVARSKELTQPPTE